MKLAPFSNLFIYQLIISFVSASANDFPFTTVIDILSHDVQFSTFLRLLQLNGYVPYLNHLQNFTLFAPVNSAFTDDYKSHNFDIENYLIHNEIVETSSFTNTTIVYYNTTRFPLVLSNIPNQESTVNSINIVENDLKPNVQNATVHGIAELLKDSPTLDILVNDIVDYENGKYTYARSLLEVVPDSLSLSMNSTILIPDDQSFSDHFNQIERNYLMDKYHRLNTLEKKIRERWVNDVTSLFKNLVVPKIVGGRLAKILEVKNLNQDIVTFDSNELGSKVSVNSSVFSDYGNIPFNFGIAHFFQELNFLNKHLFFDAEKYLHGLNCSGFVREIYFRKLEKFIQNYNGDKNITIFLPDAVLNDEMGFSKSTLLYHFSEEQIWLEKDFPVLGSNEHHTNLYNSAFCASNKKLGGKCQRMKIKKSHLGYMINDKYKILQTKPYVVGNTLIYTIKEDIRLPGDLMLSIPPFDHCSKSIYYLRELGLLDLDTNHQGYTLFLPCYRSWDLLGLTGDYIQSNITVTELIMKKHIINGVFYTDNEANITHTENLLGEHLTIKKKNTTNSCLTVELSTFKDTLRLTKSSDILFNKGVVHPLSEVKIPHNVDIGIWDLLKITKSKTFIDFITQFDQLKNILDKNGDYSVLVPTAHSLELEGIFANYTKLNDFLKLHIISANETESLLNCNGPIKTLLGQELICSKVSEDSVYLHINDGLENRVRIVRKGCTTDKSNACVFLIERPLSLDWIGKQKYHLTLPIVAVFVGVVLGIIFIISLLCCILVLRVGKGQHEASNSVLENDEESNPTQPLLPDPDETYRYTETADNNVLSPNTGATAYSTNSTREPIRMSRK